jgi:hypothetical protein
MRETNFLMGLLMFSLMISSVIHAQEESKFVGGNSLGILVPQSDLGDVYDIGLGFSGSVDYNATQNFALRLDVGVHSFSGEDEISDTNGNATDSNPEKTVYELTAGVRGKLSVFYLEGRAGYFFGFDEFGYVPAAGLRFGKFDLQLNYALVGGNDFAGFRIGYYWAK